MEKTPLTGYGRVLMLGDTDMFTDTYMNIYAADKQMMTNIAQWATMVNAGLNGHVTVQHYSGALAGLPITLKFYDNGVLTDTRTVQLDSSGNYSLGLSEGGTCDIVAKMPHWLSVRQNAVVIGQGTVLDWYFAINGDATNDNAVDLFDLNQVLTWFGSHNLAGDLDGDGAVTLFDLNLTLINFATVGQ